MHLLNVVYDQIRSILQVVEVRVVDDMLECYQTSTHLLNVVHVQIRSILKVVEVRVVGIRMLPNFDNTVTLGTKKNHFNILKV